MSKYLDSRGPTHPLTMYRVQVTVRERIGDKQMDLGPFSRKIVLTSDQPDFPKNSVIVEGTVRGDVKVGSVDAEDTGTRKGERDKIVLARLPLGPRHAAANAHRDHSARNEALDRFGDPELPRGGPEVSRANGEWRPLEPDPHRAAQSHHRPPSTGQRRHTEVQQCPTPANPHPGIGEGITVA